MKYRIKTVTFKNGRKEYYVQRKVFFKWFGMSSTGDTHSAFDKYDHGSRELALQAIDLHYEGNKSAMSVEIEYINK